MDECKEFQEIPEDLLPKFCIHIGEKYQVYICSETETARVYKFGTDELIGLTSYSSKPQNFIQAFQYSNCKEFQ